MKKYKLIIFDLDGTLLDTSKGIFNSVRYAEKMMGFEPLKDDKLKEFVGPPPKDMYMKDYGISEYDATILVKEKPVADFFEGTIKLGANPKSASNWITTNLLGSLNKMEITIEESDSIFRLGDHRHEYRQG